MTETLRISGLLREKDVKRLTRLTRGGAVSPTTIYYAGFTAPIISASTEAVVREAMRSVGATHYWQWFISLLVAAFAGISWYLIFIRWSYRHRLGRGSEMNFETDVSITDDALIMRRGGIQTHIAWACVKAVRPARDQIAIIVAGADALVIPDGWFGKNEPARAAFVARLQEKAAH